jgi:XapX domain-containing protein
LTWEQQMKAYLVSLVVGLAVGVLYGVLGVRSPAPPMIALVGLLGILLGEQIPPLIRHALSSTPASVVWIEQLKPHIFGHLPAGRTTTEKSS